MSFKDKLRSWVLPEFLIDQKTFAELVADPEFTNGEGDCCGHTPVKFYDEVKSTAEDFVEEFPDVPPSK